MERIICLAMGYGFGLLQTGYLYSKHHHVDIRKEGSGNAGSTNVLRVMGKKAAAIVFFGDAGKMILACLLTRMLFQDQQELLYLYLLYTGFGVILGHNYPFYMGFKGGKGIAASAGLLFSMDFVMMFICLAIFVTTVAWTRYVSLGSILVMVTMLIGYPYFAYHGAYGLAEAALPEFCIMTAAITLMGIWRHRANIRRLLTGTENKLGAKKSA